MLQSNVGVSAVYSDLCGQEVDPHGLRDLSAKVDKQNLQRARSVWLALRSLVFLRRLFRSWRKVSERKYD